MRRQLRIVMFSIMRWRSGVVSFVMDYALRWLPGGHDVTRYGVTRKRQALSVCALLHGMATDGFNVVSVRIKHESAVVVGVIAQAQARGAIITTTNR